MMSIHSLNHQGPGLHVSMAPKATSQRRSMSRSHVSQRYIPQIYNDFGRIGSSSGGKELPTQGDAMVAGVDPIDYINQQLQDILRPRDTEDYLAVSL